MSIKLKEKIIRKRPNSNNVARHQLLELRQALEALPRRGICGWLRGLGMTDWLEDTYKTGGVR